MQNSSTLIVRQVFSLVKTVIIVALVSTLVFSGWRVHRIQQGDDVCLAPAQSWGFHSGRWSGENTLTHRHRSGLKLTYGVVERSVGIARP